MYSDTLHTMPAKSEQTFIQSSPSEKYFSGQKWQLQETLKGIFLQDHLIGIIECFSRQIKLHQNTKNSNQKWNSNTKRTKHSQK